jgi:membrane protease YdiL (CAAX protease family)
VSIQKVDGPESILSCKFILTIAFLYFFVVFPLVHFFLRGHAWLPQYGYVIYFAGVFAYVRGVKKVPLKELGFSRQHLGRHLVIGLVLGSVVVCALPFLDFLVTFFGLDRNELFSQAANLRNADDWESLPPWSLATGVLLVPLWIQFFFIGLIYASLSKQVDPMLALFFGAFIFSLGHFNLTPGLLILGIGSAFLYRLTGTLYASILFHMGCALAGTLLLYAYPRLITILVFLY